MLKESRTPVLTLPYLGAQRSICDIVSDTAYTFVRVTVIFVWAERSVPPVFYKAESNAAKNSCLLLLASDYWKLRVRIYFPKTNSIL